MSMRFFCVGTADGLGIEIREVPSLMKAGARRAMDQTTFQNKLAELMGEISTLPKAEREKLTDLAAKTQERHEKLRKTVNDLQESMDYLRLSIKYLVFDLEATRRENSYLRKMLEQQQDRTNQDFDGESNGSL